MRVLITGASGYLAWEIVRQMKGTDEIIGASSNPDKLRSDKNYSGVSLIDSREMLSDNLKGIDIIIHTAFCRKSIGKDLVESLTFSQRLFQKAVDDGVKGIINISSQSVYGGEKTFLPTEEDEFDPGYLYALAKVSSEIILNLIANGSDTSYTSIRLASLIGPSRFVPNNIVYKFVENALNEKNISITGGKQNFSFLDVRDAAEAIIRLTRVPSDTWLHAYNLGPVNPINIKELAENAADCGEAFGRTRTGVNTKEDDTVLNAGMDNRKLYETLNWMPRYGIVETMKSTAEYILKTKLGGGTK